MIDRVAEIDAWYSTKIKRRFVFHANYYPFMIDFAYKIGIYYYNPYYDIDKL